MSLKSAVIYRDFLEDKRTSMNIYADNLESALKSNYLNLYNINSFTPSIAKILSSLKIPYGVRIRYSRYFSYPFQAKKIQGQINHIIDQSYAHLLNFIDGQKTIVTVHDIIPLLAWKGKIFDYNYPYFPLLFKLSIKSLKKAKLIIAVSHSTKKDLIDHCGLNADKIKVIHNGIDSRFCAFSVEKKKSKRSTFGFPSENKHVILITGIQRYKNHNISFQTLSRLEQISKKEIQVLWLGADNKICAKYSKEVNLKNIAIPISNLSFTQLCELYNGVDCLFFPSSYEGFGFPPLEAMACGTPVVTSNVASIPEVVGDAAIMLSPNDINGFSMALKNILEDEKLRNKYIKRGYKNIKSFNWSDCAAKVAELYDSILEEKKLNS